MENIIIKNKQIAEFIHKYKDLPTQGTPEWLAMRVNTIGGSELNQLIKAKKQLIKSKADLEPSNMSYLPMIWGNVFEDTLRDIVTMLVKTEIYESSSIPSAVVVGKTFSMDGLGLVRYLTTSGTFNYLITLFEFKCPYSREIKQGEIYPDYIPQVLSGMSDLEIPEIALYVEGQFRLSKFHELGNNPYQLQKVPHYRDTAQRNHNIKDFLYY